VKGPVNHFVRSARDVQAGLNKGNEQKHYQPTHHHAGKIKPCQILARA
jgi:hypothetical protein